MGLISVSQTRTSSLKALFVLCPNRWEQIESLMTAQKWISI